MKEPDEKTIIFLGAALLLLILILFLIQSNRVEEGVVIEKKFEPAHSELKMSPSASGMTPQLVHHDDEWFIIMENDTNTGRCWLDEVVWNKIEVGDWVNCRELKNISETVN